MDFPVRLMQRPTLDALEKILADLEALPDTDKNKAAAIAKVKAQIDDLKERGEA